MRQQAMNFITAVQGLRPAPCDSKEALEDLKLARVLYFVDAGVQINSGEEGARRKE